MERGSQSPVGSASGAIDYDGLLVPDSPPPKRLTRTSPDEARREPAKPALKRGKPATHPKRGSKRRHPGGDASVWTTAEAEAEAEEGAGEPAAKRRAGSPSPSPPAPMSVLVAPFRSGADADVFEEIKKNPAKDYLLYLFDKPTATEWRWLPKPNHPLSFETDAGKRATAAARKNNDDFADDMVKALKGGPKELKGAETSFGKDRVGAYVAYVERVLKEIEKTPDGDYLSKLFKEPDGKEWRWVPKADHPWAREPAGSYSAKAVALAGERAAAVARQLNEEFEASARGALGYGVGAARARAAAEASWGKPRVDAYVAWVRGVDSEGRKLDDVFRSSESARRERQAEARARRAADPDDFSTDAWKRGRSRAIAESQRIAHLLREAEGNTSAERARKRAREAEEANEKADREAKKRRLDEWKASKNLSLPLVKATIDAAVELIMDAVKAKTDWGFAIDAAVFDGSKAANDVAAEATVANAIGGVLTTAGRNPDTRTTDNVTIVTEAAAAIGVLYTEELTVATLCADAYVDVLKTSSKNDVDARTAADAVPEYDTLDAGGKSRVADLYLTRNDNAANRVVVTFAEDNVDASSEALKTSIKTMKADELKKLKGNVEIGEALTEKFKELTASEDALKRATRLFSGNVSSIEDARNARALKVAKEAADTKLLETLVGDLYALSTNEATINDIATNAEGELKAFLIDDDLKRHVEEWAKKFHRDVDALVTEAQGGAIEKVEKDVLVKQKEMAAETYYENALGTSPTEEYDAKVFKAAKWDKANEKAVAGIQAAIDSLGVARAKRNITKAIQKLKKETIEKLASEDDDVNTEGRRAALAAALATAEVKFSATNESDSNKSVADALQRSLGDFTESVKKAVRAGVESALKIVRTGNTPTYETIADTAYANTTAQSEARKAVSALVEADIDAKKTSIGDATDGAVKTFKEIELNNMTDTQILFAESVVGALADKVKRLELDYSDVEGALGSIVGSVSWDDVKGAYDPSGASEWFDLLPGAMAKGAKGVLYAAASLVGKKEVPTVETMKKDLLNLVGQKKIEKSEGDTAKALKEKLDKLTSQADTVAKDAEKAAKQVSEGADAVKQFKSKLEGENVWLEVRDIENELRGAGALDGSTKLSAAKDLGEVKTISASVPVTLAQRAVAWRYAASRAGVLAVEALAKTPSDKALPPAIKTWWDGAKAYSKKLETWTQSESVTDTVIGQYVGGEGGSLEEKIETAGKDAVSRIVSEVKASTNLDDAKSAAESGKALVDRIGKAGLGYYSVLYSTLDVYAGAIDTAISYAVSDGEKRDEILRLLSGASEMGTQIYAAATSAGSIDLAAEGSRDITDAVKNLTSLTEQATALRGLDSTLKKLQEQILAWEAGLKDAGLDDLLKRVSAYSDVEKGKDLEEVQNANTFLEGAIEAANREALRLQGFLDRNAEKAEEAEEARLEESERLAKEAARLAEEAEAKRLAEEAKRLAAKEAARVEEEAARVEEEAARLAKEAEEAEKKKEEAKKKKEEERLAEKAEEAKEIDAQIEKATRTAEQQLLKYSESAVENMFKGWSTSGLSGNTPDLVETIRDAREACDELVGLEGEEHVFTERGLKQLVEEKFPPLEYYAREFGSAIGAIHAGMVSIEGVAPFVAGSFIVDENIAKESVRQVFGAVETLANGLAQASELPENAPLGWKNALNISVMRRRLERIVEGLLPLYVTKKSFERGNYGYPKTVGEELLEGYAANVDRLVEAAEADTMPGDMFDAWVAFLGAARAKKDLKKVPEELTGTSSSANKVRGALGLETKEPVAYKLGGDEGTVSGTAPGTYAFSAAPFEGMGASSVSLAEIVGGIKSAAAGEKESAYLVEAGEGAGEGAGSPVEYGAALESPWVTGGKKKGKSKPRAEVKSRSWVAKGREEKAIMRTPGFMDDVAEKANTRVVVLGPDGEPRTYHNLGSDSADEVVVFQLGLEGYRRVTFEADGLKKINGDVGERVEEWNALQRARFYVLEKLFVASGGKLGLRPKDNQYIDGISDFSNPWTESTESKDAFDKLASDVEWEKTLSTLQKADAIALLASGLDHSAIAKNYNGWYKRSVVALRDYLRVPFSNAKRALLGLKGPGSFEVPGENPVKEIEGMSMGAQYSVIGFVLRHTSTNESERKKENDDLFGAVSGFKDGEMQSSDLLQLSEIAKDLNEEWETKIESHAAAWLARALSELYYGTLGMHDIDVVGKIVSGSEAPHVAEYMKVNRRVVVRAVVPGVDDPQGKVKDLHGRAVAVRRVHTRGKGWCGYASLKMKENLCIFNDEVVLEFIKEIVSRVKTDSAGALNSEQSQDNSVWIKSAAATALGLVKDDDVVDFRLVQIPGTDSYYFPKLGDALEFMASTYAKGEDNASSLAIWFSPDAYDGAIGKAAARVLAVPICSIPFTPYDNFAVMGVIIAPETTVWKPQDCIYFGHETKEGDHFVYMQVVMTPEEAGIVSVHSNPVPDDARPPPASLEASSEMESLWVDGGAPSAAPVGFAVRRPRAKGGEPPHRTPSESESVPMDTEATGGAGASKPAKRGGASASEFLAWAGGAAEGSEPFVAMEEVVPAKPAVRRSTRR